MKIVEMCRIAAINPVITKVAVLTHLQINNDNGLYGTVCVCSMGLPSCITETASGLGD